MITQNEELLKLHVQMTVPLMIMGILESGGLTDAHIAKAREHAHTIAEQGDLLLFRSKQKGGSAKVMHALCYSLAVLSCCPSGVTFAGVHFEAAQINDILRRGVDPCPDLVAND